MVDKFDWSKHSRTVMKTDQDIISAIIKLHNGGRNFDVDPTYSTGRFWQGLTPPKYKFDINPQTEGVVQASAEKLPLENESVDSIMFDPPFVVRPRLSETGIIANRFSHFTNIENLWTFYYKALKEFYRILTPKGIVAFKCQDTIDGGNEYWSHNAIIEMAEEFGFHLRDIMLLHRELVMFSPNMKIQQHARKTHCYYLVFEKLGKGKSKWRNILDKVKEKEHGE